MRAAILPIATVSIIVKGPGSIVIWLPSLKCFLFLLPNLIHVYAIIMQ